MTARIVRRTAAVLGLAVLQVAAVSIASASTLSVSSETLGVATAAVPAFYPTSVATTASTKPGAPSKGDTVTLDYSQRLQATSMCAGASNTSNAQTFAGVTVLLADGAVANDSITVTTGPLACPAPRVGTLDLGAPGYATVASITYLNSTLQINQTANSATVVLTLGAPSTPASALTAATVVRYTPDPTLTDSSGRVIGANLGLSASVRQF